MLKDLKEENDFFFVIFLHLRFKKYLIL